MNVLNNWNLKSLKNQSLILYNGVKNHKFISDPNILELTKKEIANILVTESDKKVTAVVFLDSLHCFIYCQVLIVKLGSLISHTEW